MGMICRKCKSKVETVAEYCNSCGAKLELMCDKCGESINPGAKFCPGCGDKLFFVCSECGAPVSLSAKFCQSCGHVLPKVGVNRTEKPTSTGYADADAMPIRDGKTVSAIADELPSRNKEYKENPSVLDEERAHNKICCEEKENIGEDSCHDRIYKPFAKAERVAIRGSYMSKREGRKHNYMPLLIVLLLGLAVFFSGRALHEFKMMLLGSTAPVVQTNTAESEKQIEEMIGDTYTFPAEEKKESEPRTVNEPVLAVPSETSAVDEKQENIAGAIINGTKVNMRKGPGLGNAVVYNFPGGEKVKILGEKKSPKDQYAWYNVAYKDKTGWVYGKYVKK